MNTKHTLLCILLWGALIGSAQAQGTMKIEVIGSEDSSPEREVPTITNESLERDDDGAPVELGPGEVYFKFDEADLTTDVLPTLQDQAGIRVRYRGPARAVTLRLTAPMHWEQALNLIARFSNTHLKRGAQGKLELRNRFGGKPEHRYDDLDGQVDLVVQRPKRRNVQLPPRNIPRVRLQVMASAPVRTKASVGSSRSAGTSQRRTVFRPTQPTAFRAPQTTNYRPVQRTNFRPPQRTNYRPQQRTNFRPPQRTNFRQLQRTNFRQPRQTQFR